MVEVSCCMLFMFILCRICSNEAAFIVPCVSSRLRNDSCLLAARHPRPRSPHIPRVTAAPALSPRRPRCLFALGCLILATPLTDGHGSIALFFLNFPIELGWIMCIHYPNNLGTPQYEYQRLPFPTNISDQSHHNEIMIKV